MKSPKKVFVFIREDLKTEQKIIQASHAAREAALGDPHREIAHLVLLGAKDAEELEAMSRECMARDIAHHLFHEPDDNLGYTALATRALAGEECRLFRKIPLFRENGGESGLGRDSQRVPHIAGSTSPTLPP